MKGITVAEPGASPAVSTDLAVPEPDENQILVKSIYTAVNPVDAYMADYGLLVESWPLVPGCDAAGIVVKAGKNAISPQGQPFKEGDKVFGCTRLGIPGYSPWQEYFLMDADVTFPKPDNISLVEASTAGVSILTAFLGIFDTLKIPIPDIGDLPLKADDGKWVLVLGGASSVGKSTVQTLKALGYKVATTCSEQNFESLKSLGADLTLSYKSKDEDIITSLKEATGSPSKLTLVYDAVGVNNDLATKIFESLHPSPSPELRYTTTNDWEPLPTSTTFRSEPVKLGPIGRRSAPELNELLNGLIRLAVGLLEKGLLKAGEFSLEEGTGVEGLVDAWKVQREGKRGSKKIVVKVAEE